MKLATGILILGMGLGTAGAQNPSIIDNTKAKLNAVQQQKTADINAALAASPGQSTHAQPPSAAKPAAQPASQAKAANQPMGPAVSKQPVSAASQKAAPAAGKQTAATVSPFTAKATAKTAASKTDPAKAKKVKTTTVSVKKPAPAKSTVAVEDKKNPDPKKDEHKTVSMAGGRRDPFLSPVVNHSMGGSGCSTGKRCLAVDQIALQGIVKSDAGMIAVVVNAMNKAYFLRENDPVFNGYVVKITGDSIVFKETLQDKLGKSFTREVTKKISTPAV
jgi:Tfp pilus assembly protein PilP